MRGAQGDLVPGGVPSLLFPPTEDTCPRQCATQDPWWCPWVGKHAGPCLCPVLSPVPPSRPEFPQRHGLIHRGPPGQGPVPATHPRPPASKRRAWAAGSWWPWSCPFQTGLSDRGLLPPSASWEPLFLPENLDEICVSQLLHPNSSRGGRQGAWGDSRDPRPSGFHSRTARQASVREAVGLGSECVSPTSTAP